MSLVYNSYFGKLPKIKYDINKALVNPRYQTVTNIFFRVRYIQEVLNNIDSYYVVELEEGDTPEIVADKYYGDSYRYWIVMFSNQYLDPQWDWPLNSYTLDQFITQKYSDLGIDPYSAKSYQKIITNNNITTGIITTNTVEVSLDEYNNLNTYSQTYTFPTEVVQVTISKEILSYYQYETELNDSKRTIKLLNKDYVQQIESEFKNLVK